MGSLERRRKLDHLMLLEMQDISRAFAGVPALRSARLEVRQGEVHALVGENGAGKSTMMKIISGSLRADAGAMRWHGRAAAFRSPREAGSHGIGVAHQEPLLAPHLTVAQNVFLGHEPARRGLMLDHTELNRQARRLLDDYGLPLDTGRTANSLSAAERQLLELARALVTAKSLLILDEPTSSLSDRESGLVLQAVRRLRQGGISVIYISHRLEELRSVADRVTILRDGRTVHSGDLASLTTADIIRHMAGREVGQERRARPEPAAATGQTPGGGALMAVEGLSRGHDFSDVSFTLRAGEITGMAGLIGAGRTELCDALFGRRPADSGSISIEGNKVRIRSPQDAMRAGLALLTEDRQRTGLLHGRPVRENMTIAALPEFSPAGRLRLSAERDAVATLFARLRIAGRAEQRVETLSGGNQQKSLIARWMLTRARIFLFDEPTRGIDVGAKSEVFALMEELARGGAAVLMVSSEIPELLQVADRLLVMRQGRLVAELNPAQATREEVLHWAL